MRGVFSILSCVLAFGVVETAAAQESDLDHLRQAAANAQDSGAARTYGFALLREGRYSDALTQLRRVAQLEHNTPQSLYDIARVAFAEGDYRKAQTACKPLARTKATSPLFHLCNARTFLVWHRGSSALDEVDAALHMDSNNFEIYLALGDAKRMQGMIEEAKAEYQHAAQLNAQSAEPLLALGRIATVEHHADEALRLFRRAAELEPNNPDVDLELGKALGNTPEAQRLLEHATVARPRSDEALIALGEVLLANHEAEKAEAVFTRALAINAALPFAHAGLGRAKAERGDFAGGEAELRKALELVRNSASIGVALADIVAQSNRVDDAFVLYRQAADSDAMDPTALIHGARLALRVGRDVLAAGYLERVLRDHPTSGTALALFGDVQLQRGDREGAHAYYERALATGEFPERALTQASFDATAH